MHIVFISADCLSVFHSTLFARPVGVTCISKAAVFTHSCVCPHPGTPLHPRQMSPPDLSIKPHTMLLILSVPTVDWLVEGTFNVAKVRILSLAFHKQFPPLQKGHIFLSFSGGLEGYTRSLKGAELRAFNLATPKIHTHIHTHTHIFHMVANNSISFIPDS